MTDTRLAFSETGCNNWLDISVSTSFQTVAGLVWLFMCKHKPLTFLCSILSSGPERICFGLWGIFDNWIYFRSILAFCMYIWADRYKLITSFSVIKQNKYTDVEKQKYLIIQSLSSNWTDYISPIRCNQSYDLPLPFKL